MASSIILVMFLNVVQPQQSQLKQGYEWRCTKWQGNADPSQYEPSVCLQWKQFEKRRSGFI